MAIVKQYDKRSGITYAYEAEYYWDKEKQQSRSKRKLIGRVDMETGEIIPTDGRCRKDKTSLPSVVNNSVKENTKPRHMYYGATYMLEQLSDELGLTNDLKICFPDIYKQLLSIAFYLILEDNTPLYRFEKWHITHKHPYGENIISPRSSELFSNIKDENINQFFRLQAKRRIEDEYWAYDSTSISSYSETLTQIQYGKNKENDKLPQLNLLLIFGEKSGLPFYYRKLAGNIPDSKTVKRLLEEIDILDMKKAKFVMDRGFYSEENINELYRTHIKFLLGAKMSLKLIKDNLNANYENVRSVMNFDEATNTYGYTVTTDWNYSQKRPYKGDVLKEKRRIYIHYYYSIDKGADEESAYDKRIVDLYNELKNDKPVEEHQKLYDKYFDVKKTPKRGITVTCKEDVIQDGRRYLGYFALITNEKMDAMTALHLYRMKDVVEKGFGNLKERLNLRRLLVSSERSLDGKIFTEFIALILISHLTQKMKKSELNKKYTMNQLLDKLDVIECFEEPGHSLKIGEILEKQEDIFKNLDIKIPASS